MAAEKVACRNRKWSESCRLYASVATVIFNLNGLAWQTDFRCAHYMSDGQTIDIYNSRQMMKNHGKKSAFLHEMLNIGPTLVWHWYNIILRNRVERILGYLFVIGWPRVRFALRENDEKHGKIQQNSYLIILCLRWRANSDLKAVVNEFHGTTVVLSLNGLIFAALITCCRSNWRYLCFAKKWRKIVEKSAFLHEMLNIAST